MNKQEGGLDGMTEAKKRVLWQSMMGRTLYIRRGLAEGGVFVSTHTSYKEASSVASPIKIFPGKGNKQCKGPKTGQV